MPVAPGRLQTPYPTKQVQRSAKAVREGPLGRTMHHGTPQTQGIILSSPMSDNFLSDRVVSEDTGDGGGGPISSPIWQPPPPLRPPFGLLPVPHRDTVKGVSGAHHEEGGASCSSCGNRGFTPNP